MAVTKLNAEQLAAKRDVESRPDLIHQPDVLKTNFHEMSGVEELAIAGVVLGTIGTILGIISQFWGLNLIGRRPRVIVTIPLLKFDLFPTRATSDNSTVAQLQIRATFNLVRTRGEEDLYVVDAHVRFNKYLHRQFIKYFPPNFPILDFEISEGRKLEKNKPCPFEYSKSWCGTELGSHLLDLPNEKSNFNHITNRMEEDFEIHWKYSNQKLGYYRFPPKYWHRLVPAFLRKWDRFENLRYYVKRAICKKPKVSPIQVDDVEEIK